MEKTSTLSLKVPEYKEDSKKLYKLVKELTGTKSENLLPHLNEDNALADKFADHFMDKIKNIRDSLKDFEKFQPLFKDVP